MDLLSRRRLLAEGFSDHELRRRIARGELVTLRPGSYVAGDPGPGPARHRLSVRAALGELAPDAVASHLSAAVMHGLPVHAVPLDVVHVTRPRRRSGARRGRRVTVHCAPLDADEIVEVDGTPVTSLARTLTDLARSCPFATSVVAADAALHLHRIDRAAIDAASARRARWPGLPGARRALGFARPGAATPGETLSRIAIADAGLPVPALQWVVRTAAGVEVAQVDFGWPLLHTVGEFDGRQKYGRLLRPGQSPGDAVHAEKLREDAVRATGLGMVRWGWADLRDFAPVAARLRAAFRTD